MGCEEASWNVSPVVDAFFDLCGPGADLLVIVRLKYQTPLTNLQKAGHVYMTRCKKSTIQLKVLILRCCNIEAAEVWSQIQWKMAAT